MIREAFIFLLTPTTPLAKKYGFLYSSVALGHRFKRCRSAWLPHLKNCQDLFLEQLKTLPEKNSVVILGSAHLHEIPLHLLQQNFKKVILVDVVHPLKHHWIARKNSQVELVTQDLSASLENLAGIATLEQLHQLIEKLKGQELFHFQADLIVSANLMSQLALLPIESVEKKIRRSLSIEEKDSICNAYAEAHLQNLKNCMGKKLIYADREVLYHSPSGELIYKGNYPVTFAGFKKIRDWMWLLAPLREASKDYSIEMKIEAYQAE